jgi:hypothetical protein
MKFHIFLRKISNDYFCFNIDSIPVVLLVVEGGPNTVRTGIKCNLSKKNCMSFCIVREAVVENNIPAVLLEGTGRCCDLFAKAFRLYKEHRQQLERSDDYSQ